MLEKVRHLSNQGLKEDGKDVKVTLEINPVTLAYRKEAKLSNSTKPTQFRQGEL